MLKIGEFSKLSHLTVKALRFYEKEGILLPASTDKWTGYRLYETAQLEAAASVKAYRQLGLSIEEIRAIQAGADVRQLLTEKAKALTEEKRVIDSRLSIIHHILEDREMRYQVTEKTIPEMIVYSSETVLAQHMDIMRWIPLVGEECLRLNPGMKCADPPYEFCEFLDGEYRETDDPMIVSVKPMPSSCGIRSRTAFTQLDRPGNATSMVSGTRNRKKNG